ncbi:hypothetical protein TVAG_151750 [Trichomonas vaginalis G3]|uniref:Methyltransferase domain-containing protein n=1 Tax=Trichomonas vaginalis (strain ATCC PRA-98 / G3) TaxID=412133 RepID=A2ELU0_TRIV3|nr:tRNA (uracil-5-)-methyltransferase-like protein A family [Trichomonas vaginalis G3]EAY06368.1 hypothetical protein TVAG_151750 [Trichomonas vaginalis G3]KAI5534692.1 tRNA (uracil-5-)-methyltransferase-like protein A family [Trichomonas vaginalis G3]|eukprot:XP_001318591.1 hypothetical protein [Trichomonas vaginalis G3]
MGSFLSAPVQKKERAPSKPQESKFYFADLDPLPDLEDPAEGDPCGLYLEGLNYHWDGPRFEKFLKTKCEANYTYASKKKSKYAGIIKFDNNEDRLQCYRKLVAARFGEKCLFVVPLHKDLHLSVNLCRRVRARATNPGLATADIRDRVTAWHRMPLEEQYAAKSEKYTKLIQGIVPEGSSPVTVVPVPNTVNYRNKVEMTVGADLEGNTVVGFNLGSKDEDVIAPIDNCLNVPKVAPYLARKFTDFVTHAKSPIYDRSRNSGVWKFITVRTTEEGKTMLVVVVYKSEECQVDPDDVAQLTETFQEDVDSLYLCETTKYEGYGNDPVFTLLNGTATIEEKLRGLKFDISPMSFFQTNTPGAEILFSRVESLAEVDKSTVLIDVCCGTGVIGLSMAKKAKKVIGIDIEKDAIEDAKKNATKNKIKNAEFIAAPAQDVLPGILDQCEAEGSRVVVIVDPPRDGLHKTAAKAIRECKLLKRVVYISCNPESLVRDSKKFLFAENNNFATQPFQPVEWFGVDLFPHTDRLELVMLMQRE